MLDPRRQAERFEKGSASYGTKVAKGFSILLLIVISTVARGAFASQVDLAWDPVLDARVAGYQVHFGRASGIGSGQYESTLPVTGTSATVSGLQSCVTYYFAAKSCEQNWTKCSEGFSNEVSKTVPCTPPTAVFSATPVQGAAQLLVSFADASTGDITDWNWDFGDGGSSTLQNPSHTYTAQGSYTVTLTVNGPGGSDPLMRVGYIQVSPEQPSPLAPPTANFSADVLKGSLTVNFENLSAGQFDTSTWSFGDGITSGETNPSHTYQESGIYPVSLRVSNSYGSDTLNAYVEVPEVDVEVPEADDLPMEFGEIVVNDQWKQVVFTKSYADPIVVAKPVSANDTSPAVVRIDRTGTTGFKIRVQEWDYLDGSHGDEMVSYVVMERGRYQLPNGAWVVAGRVKTNSTNRFTSQMFLTPFGQVPVMLAAVTSVNETAAVAVRLRDITTTGFQVGMREQQKNFQWHKTETIDYLAVEPSFGTVNGVRYEVDRLPANLTHVAQTLIYRTALNRTPLFLADMQTTADSDPASLRWQNRNEVGVDLWVAEEQSKDTEITHGGESVGYLLFEPTVSSTPETPKPVGVCTTPCSLWDSSTIPRVPAHADSNPIEIGMKFRSEAPGQVTGVRFYKGSGNTGTHVGRLWSSSGQLLAQATFTNESSTGWQQVNFASPVAIEANTTYVVSYYAPAGRYAYDEGFFASAYTKGPLRALSSSEAGGNGVYRYGSGGVFPTDTYMSSSGWVDLVFQTE